MDEKPTRKLTDAGVNLLDLNILGLTLNIYLHREPHCGSFLVKNVCVLHLNVT